MAKKKRRRKASLLTKAINIGVLALAFARPLQILLQRGTGHWPDIVRESTFGMVNPGFAKGSFDVGLGMQFYGPMVAAIVLKKAIEMVRRQVRI